ncbi:hypothetical protein [Sphingopyxis flava]|uniref:Uncharacterized protein n=1 Tax=Sphingopyxis flava TaxID=1507287 RepID=A0A1T5CTT4_9SPHN|nr:hypothetical protein [Sphingopyxis flava]SKB62892.1 hypothetical protein SAMN06295937_1011113 [Sphingopyxis flava]
MSDAWDEARAAAERAKKFYAPFRAAMESAARAADPNYVPSGENRAAGEDAVKRAEEWLRAISDWLLANDHDMTLPSGILDTDPLDIADDLAALSATPAQEVDETERVTVPREPTEAMYLAAFSSDLWGGRQPIRRVVDEIWDAMLRAALAQPKGDH